MLQWLIDGLVSLTQVFLTTVFQAAGASVPLLGVLYWHYCIRRRFYRAYLPSLRQIVDHYTNSIGDTKRILDGYYHIHSVTNSIELLMKKEVDSELVKIVLGLARELDNYKLEELKAKNHVSLAERYSFSAYLEDILNRKYPESRLTR